jgi:hypothetical protein
MKNLLKYLILKNKIKAKSESEKIVQEKLGFIVQYTKEKFFHTLRMKKSIDLAFI